MELDRWGGGKDLGGVRRMKTVFTIYYIRKIYFQAYINKN